jgi:hypothetical protein
MPKKQYALEKGGAKRLELSWGGMWRNFTVRLDGEVVGTIENQKALRAGQTFALADDSQIHVQLVTKVGSTELQVTRDGQPLPGSAADPEQRVKTAYGILFFIAGLNIVLGLIGLIARSELLASLGLGLGSVIFGLFFLGAAFFVMRRSQIALILAIIVFALDAILGIVLAVGAGGSPAIGGLIARVILFIPLVNGVKAIKELRGEGGA